jgi:hypothetical protein
MKNAVELASGRRGAEDWVAAHQAFVLAYAGRLREARVLSRRAVDLAQPQLSPERAALFEVPVALWDGFYGDTVGAKKGALAALTHSKNNLYVTFGAAFALALAGDTAEADRLADELEKEFPEDSTVRFNHLPALRGLLAVRRHEPEKAIDLLHIAVPYELGAPRTSIHGNFGALYHVYVRGLAYLELHRGAEAATEFQKILDHGNVVVSDPVGAMARLQLARAYALVGDREKRDASCRAVQSLWKYADADLPAVQGVQGTESDQGAIVIPHQR